MRSKVICPWKQKICTIEDMSCTPVYACIPIYTRKIISKKINYAVFLGNSRRDKKNYGYFAGTIS
jgi:hypothetical protein